jgi:subtilisin family serine protease
MTSRVLLLALVVALCAPSTGAAQVSAGAVQALENEGVRDIVVRRAAGLTAAERADVRQDADVDLVRRSTLPGTEVVRAAPGELTEAVAALNRDGDVVYAEPVMPQTAASTDTFWSAQWALENTAQWLPAAGGGYYSGGTADADMDVPEAWTRSTGAGITVGIVDTGVLRTHPDLAGRLAVNPGEDGAGRRSNGVDDDGNGYVDDWQGWDFVSAYPSLGIAEGDATAGQDNDAQDNDGHGTHVAGIVAAERDNGQGIAGVAPDARIMPLRALGVGPDGGGLGSSLHVAEAFDYAGEIGLKIVNASLGGNSLSQAQLDAIQAHPETLYVIAAGNDGADNDVTPHGPCTLPAANILCVGATDMHDARSSFSNVGTTTVDVSAPGSLIVATYLSDGYEYLSGTSMATPNAAGVVALLLSAAPATSALDLKQTILDTADGKVALSAASLSGARVNASRAVNAVVPGDSDHDGRADDADNCPGVANPLQADLDGDDTGDACDDDRDGDGYRNGSDAFPDDPSQRSDVDRDGIGDARDTCPKAWNPSQADSDRDGEGDACEPSVPPPPVGPPPVAQPPVTIQPPPVSAPLRITGARAKAARGRRVTATLTTSQLATVTAVARRQGRGRAAARARVSGAGAITIRFAKRFARGRYTLKLTAVTPAGLTAGGTLKVTVR